MWLSEFFVIFSAFNLVNSFFLNNNYFGYYGITYQLYTKQNPVNGQPLNYLDTNSVYRSNFNNSRPTR